MARTRTSAPTKPKAEPAVEPEAAEDDTTAGPLPITAPIPRTVFAHKMEGERARVNLVVVSRDDPHGEPLVWIWTAYDNEGKKVARSRAGWIEASEAFADAEKKFPNAVTR